MWNKLAFFVGGVGAVVLIVASVLGFRVLPDYIDKKIREEVSLVAHSETWNKWADVDRPIYFKVYMFNLTNPDEYENEQSLPNFTQLGPYTYRQKRRKVNITQENGERSVSYEQETYYFFDEDESGSGLNESDTFNIINLPYAIVMSQLYGNPLAGIADFLLQETIIRRNVSVGDLLFYGFDVEKYLGLFSLVGSPVPPEFAGGKFGLYRGSNCTATKPCPADGRYTIHTGVGDSEQFGKILAWNEKTELDFWEYLSPCDKINGTDGTIFPPFVKKDRIVEIYSSDLCRSLYLTYQKDVELNGIKGYRFAVPKEALEGPLINPENSCFCRPDPNPLRNLTCLKSGAIDISTCKNGAPLVLSTPYFLDGDEEYSDTAGLRPIREQHETTLDIEPNSGVLLEAHKRIQINVNHVVNEFAAGMNNTLEMLFPLLWIDETAVLSVESSQELDDKLLSPKRIVGIWRWVGVGLGIVLIVAGFGLFYWSRVKSHGKPV